LHLGPEDVGATFQVVMAGHSRSKNGVASARLCLAIHVFAASTKVKRGCPGTMGLCSGRRSRTRLPGMTVWGERVLLNATKAFGCDFCHPR
jgi:hypothetical protein